jgi:hypothetical protein
VPVGEVNERSQHTHREPLGAAGPRTCRLSRRAGQHCEKDRIGTHATVSASEPRETPENDRHDPRDSARRSLLYDGSAREYYIVSRAAEPQGLATARGELAESAEGARLLSE